MQTLDFGAIRDKNEAWYEEYDLTCPYCHGEPEHHCPTCEGEALKRIKKAGAKPNRRR